MGIWDMGIWDVGVNLVRERISESFANSVVHELRELILETSSVGLIFNGDLHSLNSLKIQVNFSPRGRRCLEMNCKDLRNSRR